MVNARIIQWMARIREFVFGLQDGAISTVGFLTGLHSAMKDQTIVIIAGLAQVLTGALSMAIGAYLSTKAEKEVFAGVMKAEDEKRQIEPYLAQEELLKAFETDGLTREEGYRIVSILARNSEAFRKTFYEKTLGIGTGQFTRPFQAAGVMYVAFLVGGLFPLTPYLLFHGKLALLGSIALSGIALFATGVFKGVLAKESPTRAGLEFLLIALISAVAGYLVGVLLGIPM